MRTALTVLALVASLVGAGCRGNQCGNSCQPQNDCCWTWKPDCCNSWDFYIPCNTLCGTDGQPGCTQVGQVPTCTPSKCPCR